MSDSILLLRERRKAIAAELHDLDERATALKAEDTELATAERVFARFVEPSSDDTKGTEEAVSGGKPQNTPTTPSMILTLLKDAQRQGKSGLEPREMLLGITKRWWPTVKSEDVAPTAWRMWKEGRLAKDGSLYMLPIDTGIVLHDDLLKN
jgi:hypothetical protein